MDPISQDVPKNRPFSVDDDGFFLGVNIDLPEIRPSTPNPNEATAETTEQTPVVQAEAPMPAVGAEPSEAGESVSIPDKLYFRIGDVAELAGVKPYVLRYWESEFPVISPEKSTTGQRVYRRTDVETILLIKNLLYKEKYSIEGARKRIREVRRDGQLKVFKQDKVYGGHEAALLRERVKQAHEITEELQTLSRLPIHDLFKY